MKKYALLLLLAFGVLAASSPAMANHYTEFTPTADCSGWCVSGTVDLVGDPYADITYTVTLNDGNSDVKTFSDQIHITPEGLSFNVCADWGMDLCGDYTASGTFDLQGPNGGDSNGFQISFNCDCPPPPPPPPGDECTRTPGYWKNHDWPVSSLTVGCEEYTRAEAMDVLWMPVRGDATIILFKHLVAAKLNVLSGSSTSISDDIDAADDFLCDHPLFSKPSGDLKTECNSLKDALAYYNESNDCDGGDYTSGAVLPLSSSKTPAQGQSWGSVKASYQDNNK